MCSLMRRLTFTLFLVLFASQQASWGQGVYQKPIRYTPKVLGASVYRKVNPKNLEWALLKPVVNPIYKRNSYLIWETKYRGYFSSRIPIPTFVTDDWVEGPIAPVTVDEPSSPQYPNGRLLPGSAPPAYGRSGYYTGFFTVWDVARMWYGWQQAYSCYDGHWYTTLRLAPVPAEESLWPGLWQGKGEITNTYEDDTGMPYGGHDKADTSHLHGKHWHEAYHGNVIHYRKPPVINQSALEAALPTWDFANSLVTFGTSFVPELCWVPALSETIRTAIIAAGVQKTNVAAGSCDVTVLHTWEHKLGYHMYIKCPRDYWEQEVYVWQSVPGSPPVKISQGIRELPASDKETDGSYAEETIKIKIYVDKVTQGGQPVTWSRPEITVLATRYTLHSTHHYVDRYPPMGEWDAKVPWTPTDCEGTVIDDEQMLKTRAEKHMNVSPWDNHQAVQIYNARTCCPIY